MATTLKYRVDDLPPTLVLLTAAIQLVLIGIAIVLTISSVIAGLVCAPLDDPVRSKLFCTSLFMVGMATALNSAFGIRIPIFQGASGTFLPPLLAMQSAGIWTCSPIDKAGLNISSVNSTLESTTNYERILELQGSLMAASIFEVIIGATGLVGYLLRFISPITISVTITLTALSLYKIPVDYCRSHWGLSMAGVCLLVIQSLYIANRSIPLPTLRKNGCSVTKKGFPVFQFFSILSTILIVWGLCALFTVTDLLPDDPKSVGYRARTDIKTKILNNTPWLIFPYPGQFGTPTFNSAVCLGFVAAVFSSILESVGDYFAASKVCLTGDPPSHAINRGIFVEGLMSILCGAMGAGHATTSYGAVVGVIGITKIASRWVFVVAGILCMVMAVIGKVGAVMAMVPDPAIGAVIFVMLGLLTSMGISALKTIDLSSSRNLSVLGISLYVGIVIPNWLKLYPGALNTGNSQADHVLTVILGTPMILGIVVCIILDNSVKATFIEQGSSKSTKTDHTESQPLGDEREAITVESNEDGVIVPTASETNIYDLPGVTKLQEYWKFFRYIPIFQSFKNTSTGRDSDIN